MSVEPSVQSGLAEAEYSDLAVYGASALQGSGRSRLRRVLLHPSLVINAASNWAALAVNIVISFFLTPFIIHYIGKSDYGIWTLVGSIVGYYGLLGLGVANAITPYTARYIGQKDWQALGKFVNTALTYFTCIGLIALIASFALASPFASFFNISPDRFASFQHTMWLMGLASAIGFPATVFMAVIRGHENYVAVNFVVILGALLRTSLTVWLLFKGFGLLGAALALVMSETFSLGANAILFRTLAKHVKMRFFSGNWQMLRILLLYGSTAIVIVISEMLRFQIDSAVIGKFLGMEAVAVYAIAATLMRLFCQVIRSAMQVLKPRFAVLYGSGQKEKLQQTLLHSTTVSSTFAFGGAAVLIVFGRQLIHLWVGMKFTDAAPVLSILVAALAFDMAQNPGINILYALDRIRLIAAIYLTEALMNVALSLLLVRHYGIIGVALGTAIPCFLVRIFVVPALVTRPSAVSLWSYYGRLMFPLFVAGLFVIMIRVLGI